MKLDGRVVGAELFDLVVEGDLALVEIDVVLRFDLFGHFLVADGAEKLAVRAFLGFDHDLLIVQLGSDAFSLCFFVGAFFSFLSLLLSELFQIAFRRFDGNIVLKEEVVSVAALDVDDFAALSDLWHIFR